VLVGGKLGHFRSSENPDTLTSPCVAKRHTWTDHTPGFQTQKLFFAFLAQKSHVKSQNRLTPYPPLTSAMKFSYPKTAILKIEPEKSRRKTHQYTGNPCVWTFLAVTPLF
jgi:hypothetical protein